MFRLSGKCVRHTKIILNAVINDESREKSRTEKVLGAVTALAAEFDLPSPLWLEKNIRDFPLTIWRLKSSKSELRALSACEA